MLILWNLNLIIYISLNTIYLISYILIKHKYNYNILINLSIILFVIALINNYSLLYHIDLLHFNYIENSQNILFKIIIFCILYIITNL